MNVTLATTVRIAFTFIAAALAGTLLLSLGGCDSAESLERDAKAYLAKGDQNSAAIQYQALLARDPRHADANFQLGKIMANVSRFPEAEAYLRRGMELGKPAAETVPVLGRVLVDLEKYKELLQLLEPDPKRAQPTDAGGLAEYALLRGYALMGQRDLTGANTQFHLAVSALPEKAKLGLARVALARGERKEAEGLIAEVLAANPRNVDARLASAELRRTAGELDKALLEYAEAVKAAPTDVHALLLQAIALVAADKISDARPMLEKASKMAPTGPIFYFAQAMIECREKRYQACGERLERVSAVLPQYMPAVLLSGQMNYATGRLELAQETFLRYLRQFPGDSHALKMLAATLLAKNQPRAALNVLRMLLRISDSDSQALGLAGQAYLQLGEVRQARDSLDKAIKQAPNNPEFRTALAMTYLAGGMRRRAEADFRAAIALNPQDTKPDYGLIMMLLAEKRVEDAQKVVAGTQQRLPSNPETQMLLGVVLRETGDARGARQAFQRAAQLAPDYFPAVQELAQMDLREGKPDAARARIREVLKKNATHLDALIAMAMVEFRTGHRPEGLAFARQAADAHPGSVDALLLVADGLAEAGELNEAINAAQQALKARPRNVRALRALGDLQMRKKDYGAAATTFTTLASAQPGSIEAALLLTSAYMAAGESRIAIATARGALKRNPRSFEAISLLGDILIEAKKYSEALEFAQKLQRDNPKSAYGYWLEGRTLLAQGDARRAVKPYETAAKLAPTGTTLTSLHRVTAIASPGAEREAPLEEWVKQHPDDGETRNYLADALSAKGRYKEAIEHYQELLRQDPKNPRALNNLAWALLATKDPRAAEYAERAFQLSPNMAPVLDTYGWVLVTQGKLYEGIQLLLKAVALDEKNPEIRYHLANALAQAGDKTRARAELKAILAAGKPFPHAEEARALAASLGP